MKKRNKNNKKAGSKKAYLPKYKPCKDRDPYTIVEVKNGWGRLKSGIGWICLDYVKKV